MLTSSVLLTPSVPTMLIDEQRGDFTEMIEALTQASERLGVEEPKAYVALSSRWISPGAFQADESRKHRSVIDLPGWGVEPRHDCPGHPTLARAIVDGAIARGLRASHGKRGMDTGVSIPMHFLDRTRRIPVVPVSMAEAPRETLREWGAALRHVLHAWPERVAFIVGGALSFSEHDFNLRREVPEAAELDERVLHALAHGRFSELDSLPERLTERARPDAGLRHLDVLRGFLLMDTPGVVIEHEVLPGIGTALVEFPLEPTGVGE